MLEYALNFSTWDAEKGDYEFQACQGYIVAPCIRIKLKIIKDALCLAGSNIQHMDQLKIIKDALCPAGSNTQLGGGGA